MMLLLKKNKGVIMLNKIDISNILVRKDELLNSYVEYQMKTNKDFVRMKRNYIYKQIIFTILLLLFVGIAFLIGFKYIDNYDFPFIVVECFLVMFFCILVALCSIIIDKNEKNYNQKLENRKLKMKEIIPIDIYNQIKEEYNAEIYTDHIRYNNEVFVSPNNYNIVLKFIENHYLNILLYSYSENGKEINGKIEIKKNDYTNLIKNNLKWIKIS